MVQKCRNLGMRVKKLHHKFFSNAVEKVFIPLALFFLSSGPVKIEKAVLCLNIIGTFEHEAVLFVTSNFNGEDRDFSRKI